MNEPRSITIHAPCVPPKTTASSGQRVITNKTTGKSFIGQYEKSKAKQAKNTLIGLLLPFQPADPLEGPVRIDVTWRHPWRKSEPKKNRADGWRWCDKRPDADNLLKFLFDVLTTLRFWNDDGQAAQVIVNKEWGDEPGIHIEMEELHNG